MEQVLVGILAGGFGTRLAEYTEIRPKPMVEVGGRPILWHIMKGYAAAGYREFVLALGYRGEVIKDYFLHYHHREHDLSIDLRTGSVATGDGDVDDWLVHLLDTGIDSMTGDRTRQLLEYAGGRRLLLTYGDAVASLDLRALLAFHEASGCLATVTAVRPPARFGELAVSADRVTEFREKPQAGEGWINGGFFVFEPGVLDYMSGGGCVLEREPLENLSRDGQLAAYRHPGFWQCMDTLRDVRTLEDLWASGHAPWQLWA